MVFLFRAVFNGQVARGVAVRVAGVAEQLDLCGAGALAAKAASGVLGAGVGGGGYSLFFSCRQLCRGCWGLPEARMLEKRGLGKTMLAGK